MMLPILSLDVHSPWLRYPRMFFISVFYLPPMFFWFSEPRSIKS